MTPVFLDTVGLIALWDKDDQWHDAAEKAYKSITNAMKRLAIAEAFTNDKHFEAAGFKALF